MLFVPNRAEIVDVALQYAGRGWRVLPTINKEPPRGFARGVHAATTDPATILGWFERWPRADVAIACGPPVVVDIDDPSAVPELVALRDTTLCASTPRGSIHLYFEGGGFETRISPGARSDRMATTSLRRQRQGEGGSTICRWRSFRDGWRRSVQKLTPEHRGTPPL